MRPIFTPPSEVAEYRIVRLLGRGAMGQVYLAHDTLLDRAVAIKFIAAEPSAVVRERFLVEARAIARLTHPNVVSVYRVGEIAGRPYLVSEFVKGKSLADLPRPVPVEQGIQIGLGLCAGLKAAHSSGVLHRDVKPANAILADSGEAKLLDFGLAKLVPGAIRTDAEEPASSTVDLPDAISGDEATLTPEAEAKPRATGQSGQATDVTLSAPGSAEPNHVEASTEPTLAALREPTPVSITKTGALVGTPRYMAPEIFAGEAATTRSDVYSLGALLFELLTGRAPFVEPDLVRLAVAVRYRAAPPSRELLPEHPKSDALSAVIDRCLRRDPKERYTDGGELLRALQAVEGPTPASIAPIPAAALPKQLVPSDSDAGQHRQKPLVSSRRVRWAIRSLLILAGVGGLALGVSTIRLSPTSVSPDLRTQVPNVAPLVDLNAPADLAIPIELHRAADLAVPLDQSSPSPVAVAGPGSVVLPKRPVVVGGKKSARPVSGPATKELPTTAPSKESSGSQKSSVAVETPSRPSDVTSPPVPAPAPTKPPTPEPVELPIER